MLSPCQRTTSFDTARRNAAFLAAYLLLAVAPSGAPPASPLLAAVLRNNAASMASRAATPATNHQDSAANRAETVVGSRSQDDASSSAKARSIQPFETPRQLLRLLDIGESELDSLADGEPVSAADEETLVRILFRMPQIALADIERWSQGAVPWDMLATKPLELRTQFFSLHGRVRDVQRRELSPKQATLFDFDHYFQVTLALSDTKHFATVFTRTIPIAWTSVDEWDERASVTAMFLKRGPHEAANTPIVFAAPRVAWLPDRVRPAIGITSDLVLLGNLGMDAGLFDLVRDRQPIRSEERECFYQLLHALHKAQPSKLRQLAREAELGPLLQHPERQRGGLQFVSGTVRQITRVIVEEPDIQERFGITHYYQLDLLMPLGEQIVQIQASDDSESSPVYRNQFPCTFCTTHLPDDWKRLVDQEVNQPAVISGFFFKLWAYDSPYVARFDARQRQLCPMFIAVEPAKSAPVAAVESGNGMVLGIAFLCMLGLVWAVVWFLHRTDRKVTRSAFPDRFQPPVDVLSEDVDREADSGVSDKLAEPRGAKNKRSGAS